MSTQTEWFLKTNTETLKKASKHREIWTSADMDLVAETMDIPIREVAEALGRTYAAIVFARNQITNDAAQASELHREVKAQESQASPVCPEHFIELSKLGHCLLCD